MPATSTDRRDVREAQPPLDRRRFLQGIGAAAVAGVLGAASREQTPFGTADFEVPSFDETTLSGTLYMPASPRRDRRAVLVPHCWATSDAAARRRAAAFAADGAVALKYDARGYGASGGSTGLVDDIALRDARALVDWARNEGILAGTPRLVVF